MGIGSVLAIIVVPRYFSSKIFIYLLFYSLFVILNLMIGDEYYHDFVNVVIEIATLLLVSSMTYYLFKYNDKKLMTSIIYSVLFIVIFTSIATFIIDIKLPGIIRELQHEINDGNTSAAKPLYRLGLSNYSLPHAVPVLIPALIMGFRQRNTSKFNRFVCLVALCLCVLLTYVSGATTPVLLAVLILIISLITKRGETKKNTTRMVILLLIALPFFTSDNLMADILRFSQDIVGGEGPIHERLVELENAALYGDTSGDLESRSILYKKSFNTFFSNIIIGSNSGFGGHSALIDRLATLGIIGFLPYVLFIIAQIKLTIRYIPSQYISYYVIGIAAAVFMLAFKNMSNWEMWFLTFTVLPIMIYRFSKE
ncbi:MAG: hypothetical protein PHE51_07460 [Eubacteriales bacterium]|nr:hypothetical protein [Eubacteriales bacterium]